MNSMSKNISGEYLVIGAKLSNPENMLLIRDRKQESPNKPKKFVLIKEGNRFQYLSSLYPIGNNKYTFDTSSPAGGRMDIQKGQYILEMGDSIAKIYKH